MGLGLGQIELGTEQMGPGVRTDVLGTGKRLRIDGPCSSGLPTKDKRTGPGSGMSPGSSQTGRDSGRDSHGPDSRRRLIPSVTLGGRTLTRFGRGGRKGFQHRDGN